MSADEDTELRDLVAQTLENNGTLGKIRAHLRASVFLALEEEDAKKQQNPYMNKQLQEFLKTSDGQLTASLVREFLSFFNLEFTLSVFEPESGCDLQNEEGCKQSRSNMARNLNIAENDKSKSLPLLFELVKRIKNQDLKGNTAQELSPQQIEDAREKFEKYDVDKNGTIDKNELRTLFIDMFPSFHRNMLERYVNDEFRAVDKDFSMTIDFNEFMEMYKRLFILCKSVISNDQVENLSEKKQDNDDFLDAVPFPNQKTNAQALKNSLDDSVKESKGGLASLSGLPSLDSSMNGGKSESSTPKLKDIDKKFSDLGIDVPNDYEEDFDEDFDDDRGDFHTDRSKKTPRSGRSEKQVKSVSEVDEEIIEEDIDDFDDDANDILNDDNSETDDRTISMAEISKTVDYLEDVK
ncbi:DgyrCDS2534 [Dimorphilus gyrociliatus]|uniref:Centrosomal protein 43 n=1 Tax=Dimorphilus gyrociliatus TaxID=2664684 RepID=A0A7I8VAM0_9ANNE|nr:DgyrCDS2534 [Dimorphilus gyrociliatus]